MKSKHIFICAAHLLFIVSSVAVNAESVPDFSTLGKALTPIGAERSGNAAGTIPEWTGGLPKNAASVVDNYPNDPFVQDKPKFIITGKNFNEYRDNLTPGQIALFKRYPDTYRMPVYTTRRSVGYPQEVYDSVRSTAGTGKLVNGGDSLTNFLYGYFAFPIPQSGAEIVWNHKTRYRINLSRNYVNAAPIASGAFTPIKIQETVAYPQFIPDGGKDKLIGVFSLLKQTTVWPARYAGNVLLVHDTLDAVSNPRMAWLYNAGQRRVRRAPQVAYDSPDTNTDGLRVVDNFFMFSGAPDRYNWKLIGKKEIYVPYNAYRLADPKLKYADIVKPGHVNPDVTRYELHRVWEVQGDLKEGERHIYARRNFFVDEDSWMILLADHYDGRGNLWRVGEGHLEQMYHKQIPAYSVEVLYDLPSGRYTIAGMFNEEKSGPDFSFAPTYQDFTTSSLRSTGIR